MVSLIPSSKVYFELNPNSFFILSILTALNGIVVGLDSSHITSGFLPVTLSMVFNISPIVTPFPYPKLYGFIDSPISKINNAPLTTSYTYKKSLTTSGLPQAVNGFSPLSTLLINAGTT